MNGAAPVPATTTNTPSTTSTTMTGVSHQWRLWRRKYQNSLRNPCDAPDAAVANWLRSSEGNCDWVMASRHSELAEVAFTRRSHTPGPIRRGRTFKAAVHRVVQHAHHSTDGCH